MRHVREKQVRSCFGGCKVNLQTLTLPPSFVPAPLLPRAFPNAFAPLRSGSVFSAGAPTLFRTLPSPSEPRAQPAPSRAERRRAQPHRLFRPQLGAVHHSQRLKPHPAPVVGASTWLRGHHCRLQTLEVLKHPHPRFGREGWRCFIYRPERAPGRCNMHLVAKSNSPGPASPSIWAAQAPKKPQAKLPVAQRGAASRGGRCKESPRELSNENKNLSSRRGGGGGDGERGEIVSESLLPTIMAPPRTRLSCLLHMQDFLHLGSETATNEVCFVSHPPFRQRGFYFPLFSYGMQLLQLFCQVEK